MPVCETCEGEDYEEIDGFFYCTTCQTQSQAFRVEEVEDDFNTQPSRSLRLKAKTVKTKSTRQLTDIEKEFGRPWHTYEAYQKVIKKQVKTLIAMGADPALKDVVFRIWCKYLSLTGIAFPEDQAKQKTVFSGFQRNREVYPPTIENPVVPLVRSKKKRLQKFGLSVSKIRRLQEQQVMMETLKGKEFYEGDNPLEELSINGDSESDEDFLGSEENCIVERKEVTIMVRTQWMSMFKTLCFCLLGMRILKCLVTASDIVRWVKQGLLPYMQVSTTLPANMKFCFLDNNAFQTKVPRVDKMYKTTQKLLDYLELRDVQIQVPTPVLISKFIVLLNLPAELHGFCQRLHMMRVEKIKEQEGIEICESNEVLAMMCIITTLQLMLGLNDRMEWELSKCAKQIMEIPGFEHRLFCWDQWVSYTTDHKLSGTYSCVLTAQFDPRSVKDIDRYVEELKSLKKNVRKMNDNCRKRCENRLVREETISAIKRPINLLLEKVKEKEKRHPKPGSGRESMAAELLEKDPMGYFMGEYDEKLMAESEPETISFKPCSLKYITQPRSFVQELENCGLDESTIYSSCLESSDEDDNKESDNEKCDENDEDFHQLSSSRRRNKKEKKTRVREKLSRIVDLNQSGNEKFDKKKLLEISDIVLSVHKNFPLVDPMNASTNQSASLQWLIQICAEVIQCSVEVLQSELVRFQISMFGEDDTLQTNRREFLQDVANQT